MDTPENSKPELQTLKLMSAQLLVPYKSETVPQGMRDLATVMNPRTALPLMIYCESNNKVPLDSAYKAFENSRKNSPGFEEEVQNNPNFKMEFIEKMTRSMPMIVPLAYLANQKPGYPVMYQGMTQAPKGYAVRTSNCTEERMISSSKKDDPNFVGNPHQEYVTTPEFCKQTNQLVREFDSVLRPGASADEIGIVNGWTGGKPLIDTDTKNRAQTTRPR